MTVHYDPTGARITCGTGYMHRACGEVVTSTSDLAKADCFDCRAIVVDRIAELTRPFAITVHFETETFTVGREPDRVYGPFPCHMLERMRQFRGARP